ncbi:MAG: hypothetical protein WBK72_07950, partial [Bacillota bacterium]
CLPRARSKVAKSFTLTTIGLAVEEVRLSVDDPVISFFPHELPTEIISNLAAMQVKHLLTMSTGHTLCMQQRRRCTGCTRPETGILGNSTSIGSTSVRHDS